MKKITLIGSLLILCLVGCAAKYLPVQGGGILGNKNYSFAIYNESQKLISHPIMDLQAYEKATPDITDIYIISHGWNYTLPEAIANYQKYISHLNSKEKELKQLGEVDEPFRPYYIFVAWPSASRPLTNLASTLLPFEMDQAILPATLSIDNTVFFLPTVWKQSINAQRLGLGVHYPNDYLFEQWHQQPFGVGEKHKIIGRDLPISLLVYELITKKHPHGYTSNGNRREGKAYKIHLVGHSYGAKVMMLAALESVRQYVAREAFFLEEDGKGGTRVRSLEDRNLKCQERSGVTLKEIQQNCGENLTELREQVKVENEKLREEAEYFLLRKDRFFSPIESLILFNPAFRPKDVNYLLDSTEGKGYFICGKAEIGFMSKDENAKEDGCLTDQLLSFISRKAIIFSSNDTANGWLYSVGQNFLNTTYLQTVDSYVKNGLPQLFANDVFPDPYKILGGGVALAFEIVAAPFISAKEWIRNTSQYVEEFQQSRMRPPPIPFFDQPALGRTGFKAFSYKGKGSRLGPLKEFAKTPDTEIGQREFCLMASQLWSKKSGLFLKINREKFYSFDASEIYNSRGFQGAHNDLSSEEKVSCLEKNLREEKVWNLVMKKVEEFPEKKSEKQIESLVSEIAKIITPNRLIGARENNAYEMIAQEIESDYGKQLGFREIQKGSASIYSNTSSTHDLQRSSTLEVSEAFPSRDPSDLPSSSRNQYELQVKFPDMVVQFPVAESEIKALDLSLPVLHGTSRIRSIGGYEFLKATNLGNLETSEFIQDGMSKKKVSSGIDKNFGEKDLEPMRFPPIASQLEVLWKMVTKRFLWDEKLARPLREDYQYWFNKVRLKSIVGDDVYLEVPHSMALDWINPVTIKNIEEFLQVLDSEKDDRSRFLKEKLPADLFKCLRGDEDKDLTYCDFGSAYSNSEGKALSRILSQELYDIVSEQKIYAKAPFQTLPLENEKTVERRIEADKNFSGQLSKLHAKNLSQIHKIKLNRLLLTEAYPEQLKLSNTTYENWAKGGLPLWGDHLLRAFNKALTDLHVAPKGISNLVNNVFDADNTLMGYDQEAIMKTATKRTVSRICILKKQAEKAKRDYTFNFVFNFSKKTCIVGEKQCDALGPSLSKVVQQSSATSTFCWPSYQRIAKKDRSIDNR